MEFSREALELLLNTGQQAAKAELVDTHDPREVVLLHGTDVTRLDVPPPVRQSVVHSLEALIELATKEAEMSVPVVWHHNTGVVLVLDDADRRDHVFFPLDHSREFAELVDLNKEIVGLDQRSFVRMLRQTLGVPAAQIGPFRRIEWSVHKAAEGQVEHGNDRIGRDIQAQVGQATQLPEDMVLNVPVYEQLGERDRYQVRCDIEIDVAGERLALVPVAGEIRTVIDQAQASIHQRLDEGLGDVPVYYGQP